VNGMSINDIVFVLTVFARDNLRDRGIVWLSCVQSKFRTLGYSLHQFISLSGYEYKFNRT
jgi:hypothetical protein